MICEKAPRLGRGTPRRVVALHPPATRAGSHEDFMFSEPLMTLVTSFRVDGGPMISSLESDKVRCGVWTVFRCTMGSNDWDSQSEQNSVVREQGLEDSV